MAFNYVLTESSAHRVAETVEKVLGKSSPLGPTVPGQTVGRDVRWLCKSVGEISAESTGDVEIYSGETEGSETATGKTLRAYNRSTADIPDDEWVYIECLGGMANSTWSIYSGGTTCEAQNEIQIINIFGSPEGGTFSLDVTVDGTEETMTFNWDDTAAEVETELETHSKIASGDVDCTSGPFPDAAVKVEFQGDLEETDIPIMMPDHGLLTGGAGVVVLISVDQHGRA